MSKPARVKEIYEHYRKEHKRVLAEIAKIMTDTDEEIKRSISENSSDQFNSLANKKYKSSNGLGNSDGSQELIIAIYEAKINELKQQLKNLYSLTELSDSYWEQLVKRLK